ncbi:TOBE domain-containing protein [Thermomonas sp. HDW16]|uniref:TOBE domain-containing protein n=1 Tax=Thermomonas sp. HDW16 TaxID=2714945 RepID=UPI00140A8763|nr:TOBE domain-containing protein [Thermomonas sp. HDW16]QIL20307.1 TOBE domain-containing protein [Thermomonas sp. HDW16]
MSRSAHSELEPMIDLRGSGVSLTPARARLLQAIHGHGSISAAARAVGMSYKGAWDAVAALNKLVGEPLVTTETGGSGGGGARLTPMGQRVLAFHGALTALQQRLLANSADAGDGDLEHMLRRLDNLMLKTSARNQYEGTVQSIQRGAVNSEVILALDGGERLVAIVTNGSVDELGLAEGSSAIALVKASFVLLAEADGLRTSARNALAGTVSACREGAVNAEVELALAAGKRLVATVTNESLRELDIQVGKPLLALVKASHVILAVAV